MAAVLKINPGFDPSYPWREIGTAATPAGAGSPLDYYLVPAEKGGEPPGVWAGRGLETLGFTAGQVVDREVFEKLYGEHLDPRDPAGKTRLGRAPQRFRSEEDIYADYLAAEPHATPLRQAELRAVAKAETRHAVPFWDATLSVSKSVTLFYGGLLAAAERARQGGDEQAAAEWERKAARAWAGIMKANNAALEFLQDEAGMTRTGYHRGSGTESNAELGKWEHARHWVIASFRQHTSRDGDPQLHVHNLVLNKVQTERDGAWRKLDSRGEFRNQGAAAAIAAAELESDWAAEFGVHWIPRADGHGREIAGVTQGQMELFSQRRVTITAEAQQIAAEHEARTGRAPDARQMYRIQKDVAYRTRARKPEEPLDLRAKLAQWEATAREADLGELADIPAAVEQAARAAHGQTGEPAGQQPSNNGVRAEAEPAKQKSRFNVRYGPRPADVVARTAQAIGREFVRQQGRAARPGEFARIARFASFITLRGTDPRPVDAALLLRAWQAQERNDTQAQRDIRREIAHAQARAAHAEQEQTRVRVPGYPVAAQPPDGEQARQLMAEAVTITQTRITAWTKADLIRYLGEALPAGMLADRATLEQLASQAVSGGTGERVELLSAPDWLPIPASLRRADGESVFRPHGTERYASGAQLDLEARLLARAQTPGAPHLDPDEAARLLGADRAHLEAQLRPGALAGTGSTGSGLRDDQAAAAYLLLTSARRAEVMIGPAGTGKTRTATELARIWGQAGPGPAVALTTSSNARNVIKDEARAHGVQLKAYNTAEWLGHTKTARQARRPVPLTPGSLVILDEASMMSLPDLDAIIGRATQAGAKVVVTGDPVQMQAPEGGGGLALLARRLGHVQLTHAGRFTHEWEQDATLRLRDGDVTVLADYTQHDRLHAGPAEQILEDATRAYLHDRLTGKDTLLMAGSDNMAAELSRRVRDDLIHWGIVSDGPTVYLRNGAHASTGDWIMARENDKQVKTDREDRGITNRDVLRITDTDPDGTGRYTRVVRLTGRDPSSGAEQWSAAFDMRRSYLERETHLAYAVTFHSAEGRTADSGLPVFTGEEDRQAVTVGMTRGRDNNEAFISTGWRIAAGRDPAPGTRAAPELARQHHLDQERDGQLSVERARPTEPDSGPGAAVPILAACLDRDGQQRAATDVREAEWSDADRLDVLGVQWAEVTRSASQQRYQTALGAVLGAEQARQVADDPAATWLWRSLREAEAAGLDGPDTLRQAAESGPLDNAGSVAKVLDWRIRQHTAGMPARAARPFTEQVPQTGDAETDQFAAALAAAMDDRQQRLGEHAAEHPPTWAASLGPVPSDPAGRAGWEYTAGLIGRFRERWGYAHPAEPIGPKPGVHSPDAQADWQAAAQALGRQPGDLSEYSDGQLWAWRSAFARAMEWAPAYKGEDLALVRGEVRRAQIEADRARRNAGAALTGEARQRLAGRADAMARWEDMTRDVADRLAEAQAGYDAWETATAPTRDQAVAADAELRGRHPSQQPEPLHATRPEPQARPDPAAQPPAAPEPDPNDSLDRQLRMDQTALQIEEARNRLTEADERQARQARQRAAEITASHDSAPSAPPSAGWRDELAARQRQAVYHEPLPRVPATPELTGREATLTGPEAAD
ncbi:MAG TPA: MobF family relaxase [Streptosporangiaceae bacterium]|jgi:conjugative relaxase-like TrwC/TraI family protein